MPPTIEPPLPDEGDVRLKAAAHGIDLPELPMPPTEADVLRGLEAQEAALRAASRTGSRYKRARAAMGLGAVLFARGDWLAAAECWQQARADGRGQMAASWWPGMH